jgi:hypothetical protein
MSTDDALPEVGASASCHFGVTATPSICVALEKYGVDPCVTITTADILSLLAITLFRKVAELILKFIVQLLVAFVLK